MMIRRSAPSTLLVVGSLVLAAGCSSPSGGSQGAPAMSGPPTICAADEQCPADLLIWADADRAAALRAFVEAFGREHALVARIQVVDGIPARLDDLPPASGRSLTTTPTTPTTPAPVTTSPTTTAPGSGTTTPGAVRGPDVFVGAHDWLGRLVSRSLVRPVPLTSEVSSRFADIAIRATTYRGVGYGVPHAVENVALVRNTALAPDAPATMDDLVASGRDLVAAQRADRILAQFVSPSGNAYYALPYLAAYDGGGVFGLTPTGEYDATTVIVNSPGSVRGGEVLAKLGAAGVLRTDVDDSTMDQMFAAGTTPYLISGPWSVAKAKSANVGYAISPLPRLTGGGPMRPFVGVQMFYVSASARNPQEAQDFVTNWVPRKEVQLALFGAGRRPPAQREAYEEATRTDPDVRAWFEAGSAGMLIPSDPVMDAVWKPAGEATVDIITGRAAAKARLDALQREILQIVAKD